MLISVLLAPVEYRRGLFFLREKTMMSIQLSGVAQVPFIRLAQFSLVW